MTLTVLLYMRHVALDSLPDHRRHLLRLIFSFIRL